MAVETLEVELGTRSYPIRVGRGLHELISSQVTTDQAEGRRIAVITDANVIRQQSAFLNSAFGDVPHLALPAGESTKAFRHLEHCCDFLAEAGLDRGGHRWQHKSR